MPEATSPIPTKRPEDPEEVAQELTLAANSWQSGDQTEALAALRRAASVAYRLHAGRRVSELAKAVAELSKTMMGGAPSTANQKAGAPTPSAATRAAAPIAPKAPPAPAPPPADPDDIPISLDDVEVVDDPFPSIPPAGAAPPAKKPPAAAAKKEAAAPTPVERASRTSSRPGKARRSTPPKSKETEKSGSLVVAAPAATAETSGVLDVSIKDVTKATDAAINGANGPASEPNPGDRQTSPGDLAVNPALHHRPTPVGEDHPATTSGATNPPPTKDFTEAASPSPPAAKNVASKTQLPIDPPTVADLANVVTLASLDPAARAKLVASAKAIGLAKGERVDAPSVVVVVRGEVDVRPKERAIAVDRIPAGEARTLEASPPCASGELVLVAGDSGARCLAFPKGALDFLGETAAEVHQALQRRADELCAFAAVLRERPIGSLADGLLLELRRRSEIRRLDEGTIIVRASEAVRALVVVASGALTLHAGEASPEVGRIRPGEVLFPRELVSKSPSPREVRVAAGGALILAARKGPTGTLLGEHEHLRKALETWGADNPFQEW